MEKLLVIFLTCTVTQLSSTESTNGVILFDKPSLEKIRQWQFNATRWHTTLEGAHRAQLTVKDPVVSHIVNHTESFYPASSKSNYTGHGFFNLSATFVGYNVINLTIFDKNNLTLGHASIKSTTLLSYEKLTKIFSYIIYVLVAVMYVNMGATLDIQLLKQFLARPVGPMIGLFCQYLFMPMIGFALATVVFPDDPLLALGMFLNGASPGGGGSNTWTLLLGGSLDMSIIMTFTSTLFAFGTVPLWVLTLGPKILEGSDFKIPYTNIVLIIVLLAVPCSIGILLQFRLPKVAKFLEKHVLKRMAVFNMAFIFTFGVYANWYIFSLFTRRIILATFLLPFLGFFSGMLMACILRRPLREVIAISIETGVQNTNIVMVILKLTLDPPAGELTVVIPVCTLLMMHIPLVTAVAIRYIYLAYRAKMAKLDVAKKENSKSQDQKEVEPVANGELKMAEKDAEKRTDACISDMQNSGIINPAARLSDE